VQIAVHAGHGDITTAIDVACKYLDVFQNDAVVWEQLGQLYLQAGRLEQAQFCLEEQLLLSPGDVVIMLKLADLLYEQAGPKVAAARGYYAKVTEISRGENVRALYGLLACEAFGAKAEGGKKTVRFEGLAQLARERLRGAYSRAPEGLSAHVDALLRSQR
jgi:cytochrome c-type biogenesis protein CcmH/NrfG